MAPSSVLVSYLEQDCRMFFDNNIRYYHGRCQKADILAGCSVRVSYLLSTDCSKQIPAGLIDSRDILDFVAKKGL